MLIIIHLESDVTVNILVCPLFDVLINSLVISRIEYCSSLLYKLHSSSIAPLHIKKK